MKFIKSYQIENVAERYDVIRFTGKGGEILNDAEIDIMLSLADANSVRLLEMGSGTGRLTQALLKAQKKVTCVEPSLNMIQIAKGKGIKARFVRGDALSLPFHLRQFAGVITLRVMIHFTPEEIKKVIEEVKQVLDNGGYFVFDTINTSIFNLPHRLVVILKHFFTRRPIPTFFVADQTMIKIIKQSGLNLERIERRFAIQRWVFRVSGYGWPILWRLNRWLEKNLGFLCTVSFWKLRVMNS